MLSMQTPETNLGADDEIRLANLLAQMVLLGRNAEAVQIQLERVQRQKSEQYLDNNS